MNAQVNLRIGPALLKLSDAIDSLTRPQQELFTLIAHGLPNHEIGVLLGIPHRKMGSQIADLYKTLDKELEGPYAIPDLYPIAVSQGLLD